MSQELTTTPPAKHRRIGALAIMGERYNVEPAKLLETLKDTVFKGATEAQLMALCIVANEYDLNPFVKEIYAFPAKGGGIVPVISIDGWLRRINSHPQFDGMDFVFEGDGEKPISCTCSIFRHDRSRPVSVTEYYKECFRNTDPWNQCPRRMLRHKAIIQCARVAFGFAGNDPEDGEFIAEREAKGREVPAAKVPLLPDAPASRQKDDSQVISDDRAKRMGLIDNPIQEFWSRADAAGWDRQRLLNALFEAAWIKSDAEEDFTEAEAVKSLAAWGEIVSVMGGDS